jgi:molecular chaperone GrpE
MMKKKPKEQEEANETKHNKTTDNKETAENTRNDTGIASEGDAETGTASIKSETDKLVAEKRAIEEKLADMQDKYIRLSAEFDNYRKRTLREKMELSKYAGENLLLKFIPIMDDFERALKHMDTEDSTAIKNGIDLIYIKLSEFLKQNGIKEIESLNSDFNVDIHEAVAKVPAADEGQKGKVVDVVLKGYYLQDKVLRFSKVVVGE